MSPSLVAIHELEMAKRNVEAIEALEAFLLEHPGDAEAVIRLGFNCWYVTVENEPLGLGIDEGKYASRFMQLFRRYRDALKDNADFCWAYGLGISMFWHHFPGAEESLGEDLLAEARRLDDFWRRFPHVTNEEKVRRLSGRGILEEYYKPQTY